MESERGSFIKWGPEKRIFHGTESKKGDLSWDRVQKRDLWWDGVQKGDLLQDGVQRGGVGGGLSLNGAKQRKEKGFQSMGSLERGLLPGIACPGKTFLLGRWGSRKLAVFLGRPFSQDSQKKEKNAPSRKGGPFVR